MRDSKQDAPSDADKALKQIRAGKPKAIPFQPIPAKSIAYVGGLSVTVYLVAGDAVLRLMIPLGKTRIKGNSVVSIAVNKGEASLFRGKDARRYVLPRGAVPPLAPSIKRESAVSGKFICIDIPAQKTWPYHGKTKITVKDMQLMFPSGRVTVGGPLTFILRPFPPGAAAPANGAAAVGANKAGAKVTPGFEKIDAFARGDARIAPGLTRAEIREQLSKGKVKSHKPYAFRKPQPEMFKRNVWVISYGPEIPGMGRVDELRISFTDSKVSKLEHKVYLCP